VALQSLKEPGRLTYKRFLELFRHMIGLLGRVISPSQGLYLHRTTQHRKTWTNIHALSGIRTHDPSNQRAKTHASDPTATVTDLYISTTIYFQFFLHSFLIFTSFVIPHLVFPLFVFILFPLNFLFAFSPPPLSYLNFISEFPLLYSLNSILHSFVLFIISSFRPFSLPRACWTPRVDSASECP
jgi:hypothetical protein